MKQTSAAPVLAELTNPTSLDAQTAALRTLKNEIIGHQQRKELWIRLGVVAPLARILTKPRTTAPHWQDGPARPPNRRAPAAASTEADVLIEAVIVVGSLAQGGPQFVLPLVASQIIAPLASLLNPATSSPTAILAALRTLNTIADSAALEYRAAHDKGDWALRALYTDQNLAYLADILQQDSPGLITQQQIALAAALVAKSCQEEPCRRQIASSGVLEALATRVASFVLLSADHRTKEPRLSAGPPKFSVQAASSRARLAPILQATGTIITNSSVRVTQFLRAPAFASVFQHSELDGWKASPAHSKSPSRTGYRDSSALTPLHRASSSQATSFPPLGEMARWGKPRPARTPETSSREAAAPLNDPETPLVGWLIHLIQSEQGLTRLMAAWILAIIFREGYTSEARESTLSMQLIPMLVRMLEADNLFSADVAPSYDDSVIQPPRWLIKRLAPQVLGLLTGEHEMLQRAASEAGGLKKLSQMLKQTFDALPQNESIPFWSPDASSEEAPTPDISASFCKLGPAGLTPSAYQVLQTRASVFGAIAAMATRSDDFRKAIIANGVLPYLISSLKPLSSTPPEVAGSNMDSLGNPTAVLMQACAAATALSRSVSTLRTNLIEAGLAPPIFALLQHPDIQVQIAATGAVCNIVLEFSPMRQDIVDAGVLTTLCRHAHSPNSQLRLNSLWALKHLVHSADNKLKMNCVNGLGAEWLKQIICGESDSHFSNAHVSMGSSNAAGEQVDLLNAVESGISNPLAAEPSEEDEVSMVDSIGNLSRSEAMGTASRRAVAMQEDASDRLERSRREDVLVQEQGLDLMRNLLSGSSSPDMIDYLFQELGQDSLFSIFTSLLRSRNGSTSSFLSSAKHEPPHPEIVHSVVFILVHLATGNPRHRQLLLAQSELMQLFVPLAAHPHASVRIAYAWFVINLTWVENSDDRLSARARARELRKLGLEERLETLQRDSDLDVRERAKQAAAALSDLLKGSG